MTITDYQRALFQEMHYLKNAGGRNYKVSNGIFLGISHGSYAYSFEFESEQYLSDDAPVVLTVGNDRAYGTVLVCEGFQVIIVVDRDFGSRIVRAQISVEPWKLLETLHHRVSVMLDGNHNAFNRIALELLEKGPKLATTLPIDNIEKGQDNAKRKGLTEDITVIWGPPGTGKTYTMAQIAIDALRRKKSVLIVSHSNISVDGAVLEIVNQLRQTGNENYLKNGQVFRYGYVRDERLTQDPDAVSFNFALKHLGDVKAEMISLQQEKEKILHGAGRNTGRLIAIEERLKKIRIEVRHYERQYIERASVVATTISKATVDPIFENRHYDYVMFDEVSMAYVPQLICAASFARHHFIAVGDFRQLAPIAQSEAKQVLCRDIFSYLGTCSGLGAVYYHPWLVMLNEQRRMYPDISAFVNRYVYKRLLRDYQDVAEKRRGIVESDPLAGHSMSLIDLKGTYCASAKDDDNSRYNILSAVLSFATAMNYVKHGGSSAGIVTPYAAQTRLIRAMLQDYSQNQNEKQISCATVHQFQGSERDLIVMDAVESYPSAKPGWLMSKNENGNVVRLINVAVTRARGKFITVANSRFWIKKVNDNNNLFYVLVQYLIDKGYLVSHKQRMLEKYIADSDFGNHISVSVDAQSELKSYLQDLNNAQEKIVLSIPDASLDDVSATTIYKTLMRRIEDGIFVYCKSNERDSLSDYWKSITHETTNAIFPLTVIDDKIIWYGMPSSEGIFHDGDWNYKTVCPIYLRIKGQHTVDVIRSLTNLEYWTDSKGQKRPLPKISTMKEKDDKKQDNPGLSAYIYKTEKCPKCGQSMSLMRSRYGKCYLKCSSCGDMEYLTKDMVNEYIELKHITCPIHHCQLHAGLSKYGIYVRCVNGHFLKPDEI